jgi:hypothetical protein
MFNFFKKKQEIKVEKVIKTYEKVNKIFSITIPVIIRLSSCGSNNFLIKYDNNIFIDYIKNEIKKQENQGIIENKKICVTSIKKNDSYSSLNCNCELVLSLMHENSQFDKNVKIIIPSKFSNNPNVVYRNDIIDPERLPGLDKLIPFLNSVQFNDTNSNINNNGSNNKTDDKNENDNNSDNNSDNHDDINGGYYWKTKDFTIPYALFQMQEKRFPITEKNSEIMNDKSSEILNELQSNKKIESMKMINFEIFNSKKENLIYIDKRFFPLISSNLKSNMKFSYLLSDKRNCLKLILDNNLKSELTQTKEESIISLKLEFVVYEVYMEDVNGYEFPIKLIF